MKKILWVAIIAFSVISCKKTEDIKEKNILQKQNITSTTKKVSETKSQKIELGTIQFPEEIEGCSCYFAANRQEFVKQNYLYVDDYQKNAYLKINGENVKIPFDKDKKDMNMKNLNIQVKNDDYTVTLKCKMVEEGEVETNLYKGTLTVENNNGQKIQTPVYGECGC